MFQLKNWHLEIWNGKVVGIGYCFENPRFPPGYEIHTSRVLEIQVDERSKRFLLLTRSGSCYETELAEIDPNMIERTMEVLQSKGICLDGEECLALRLQREQEKWKEFHK